MSAQKICNYCNGDYEKCFHLLGANGKYDILNSRTKRTDSKICDFCLTDYNHKTYCECMRNGRGHSDGKTIR